MPILPPLLGQPDIEGRVVLGVGGRRGGERVPEGFLEGFCWCGALVSVGRVDVGTEMAGQLSSYYHHHYQSYYTLHEIKVSNSIGSTMS